MRTCLIMIAVLFLAAGLQSCAGTAEKRAENRREGEILRDEGFNYLSDGNMERAQFNLTKAVRLIPNDAEAHFGLGTIYLLRTNYELAVEEFERTIDLDKTHGDAYNNLGFTFMKLGRWDEAISACRKAMDQIAYDTPERAMTIIGWSYYKKGEAARALEMLHRALNTRDNQPDIENMIAQIYLEEGRLEKSKAMLLDLLKRVPGFTGARLNMGIVYYKEKDYVAARREFRKVLELTDGQGEEGRLARGYLDLIE
ncbi:MAG: tetratricopeptide repeat protein [bacterium]|nr:tetratricopeptide repeat protein [bacterium]MDT8396683.1 tetratricopeptide repeat protein [bacterium]